MEADARRLQTKEEELLRRKEALRTRLAQLRKERRDLRAAIEANAGRRAPVQEGLPPSVCRRPLISLRLRFSWRPTLRPGGLEALPVSRGQVPGAGVPGQAGGMGAQVRESRDRQGDRCRELSRLWPAGRDCLEPEGREWALRP